MNYLFETPMFYSLATGNNLGKVRKETVGTKNIVLVDLNFYDSGIREESTRALPCCQTLKLCIKEMSKVVDRSTSQHFKDYSIHEYREGSDCS